MSEYQYKVWGARTGRHFIPGLSGTPTTNTTDQAGIIEGVRRQLENIFHGARGKARGGGAVGGLGGHGLGSLGGYGGLGAITADAGVSVKSYVVSGTTVWGSVNSAETDSLIKQLKAVANRFGAGLDTTGLIGPKAADAIKKIGQRFQTSTDGVDRVNANYIFALAALGPQQLATHAYSVYVALKSLADSNGYPMGVVSTSSTSSTPRPTTPKTPTTAPIFTPAYAAAPEATFGGGLSGGKLALGAGVAVAAFFLVGELKKGKSKKGSRR